MRTTITLDPDTESLVKRLMEERGITFKEAVNSAIRVGLTSAALPLPFSTPAYSMGAHPHINLHQSLRLAGDLEDEEIARKIASRR